MRKSEAIGTIVLMVVYTVMAWAAAWLVYGLIK